MSAIAKQSPVAAESSDIGDATPSTQPSVGNPAGSVCSDTALRLAALNERSLETVFVRGTTPNLETLEGWQFRGINTPFWASLVGIKKFIKGFYRVADQVFGYNTPVLQNGIRAPWQAKPNDDTPKRFGFYRVDNVDPTARDNAYLHAVLLDYGRGDNKSWDPTRGLRDYLVRVSADNDDLFLGKAYYAVGSMRVPSNFFVLERDKPASQNGDLR